LNIYLYKISQTPIFVSIKNISIHLYIYYTILISQLTYCFHSATKVATPED